MRRERPRVGPRRIVAVFAAAALVVLAVAAFFLHSTQAEQRSDLRDRYADRTEVSGALLDSLFAVAFRGQAVELSRALGAKTLSTARLDAYVREGNAAWAAVVDDSGRVIGASGEAPRAALQRLAGEPFVRTALRPGGYGLGDIEGQVLPTAIGFSTPSGWRALVSGSQLALFRTFLEGTIRPLPGVRGARAYVFDGNSRRLAATARGIALPAQTPELLAQLGQGPRGSFHSPSGDRFYASDDIRGSRWRLVVTVSNDVLYASASGRGRAVPWIILALSALALLGIGLLLRRLIGTATALSVANADLGSSNAELARSNADLEQFAYVASHDLSEPLRTVAGFSQLLGKRYRGRLDDEADLFIHHMTSGVDRMQQLIDDLLLYSRVGRTPIGSDAVQLDDVLDEVLQSIGPAVRERAAQVTSDELPVVRGERGELRQVLQNLIVNAMKFTAPDVTPRIHVGAHRDGRSWAVTVADNGIGVAPEQREAIFKMFGRLHAVDAHPGTGIGLAVVKRIVEHHGGHIWVEAGQAGGSVFTFTLPDRTPVTESSPPRGGVPA